MRGVLLAAVLVTFLELITADSNKEGRSFYKPFAGNHFYIIFTSVDANAKETRGILFQPLPPPPHVDYFEQFCAISKVPMVLIKENISFLCLLVKF